MTAILLSTDSTTQTFPQGTPTMKGRALIAYGNGSGVGGPTDSNGFCSIGFRDETDGVFSACGFNYQYISFEQSGSGGLGPGPDFYANLGSEVGVFINRLGLSSYQCGELDLVSLGLAGGDMEGLGLLSGITLESKVGWTQSFGTGPVTVTGLGFAPNLVLFSSFGRNYFGAPPVIPGERGALSFGAYDGTNQWVAAAQSGGWLSGGTRYSTFSESFVVATPYQSNVSAVSLDADGFTLNWAGANDSVVLWQAFYDPAGQWKVGTGVEGDTSITTGFPAELVLFGNSGVSSLDTLGVGCSVGIGGADDQLHQYSGFGAGGSTTQNRKYWDDTHAISVSYAAGGGVPALDAQAQVTAVNPTTVGLNWTTTGGGGARFGWVAMKTSKGPGFAGCPAIIVSFDDVVFPQ